MFIQNLIHANIFFFITSITVAVIAIAVIIVTVYLVQILRNVRDLSEKAKNEGKEILSDIADLRGSLREEGLYIRHLTSLFKRLLPREKKRKKSEHHE